LASNRLQYDCRHCLRESNELRENMDVMVEAYEILSCRMDLAAKTSRKLKINAWKIYFSVIRSVLIVLFSNLSIRLVVRANLFHFIEIYCLVTNSSYPLWGKSTFLMEKLKLLSNNYSDRNIMWIWTSWKILFSFNIFQLLIYFQK